MGSIATSSDRPRPGLMFCVPSLHEPTPSNVDVFIRWTKLHYRDLLNVPTMDQGGQIYRALRFTAGNDYLHTILATDISIWHTPGYHAVSRRLDLENTRKLEDGEEPVGCEKGRMVWDLCNAKFAIYEEVQNLESRYEAYQNYDADGERSWIVGVSTSGSEADVKNIQAGLLERVKTYVQGAGKMYSSLYKHAGRKGQPHMHPEIENDVVGGGEWLVLVLVVGDALKEGDVQSVVNKWVTEERDVDVKYRVWGEELNMS